MKNFLKGQNTTESMLKNKNSLKCPNCGGIIKTDVKLNKAVCPYCDSEFEVVSDEIKKEIPVQPGKIREEEPKKKKTGLLIIIIAVISLIVCLSSFSNGEILKGLLAGIQSACFIVVYLLGANKMKASFKNQYAACLLAGLILIVPVMSIGDSPDYETIEWNSLKLSSMLPEPASNKAEVSIDSEEELDVYIYKIEEDEYDKYVDECKEKGFTVEKESEEGEYSAYNDEGYHLKLSFSESSDRMNIYLTEPIKLSKLSWPKSGPAALLPAPDSQKGKIEEDSSLSFSAYVGNMSKESFDKYVAECKEKGFTKDYTKDDEYYSAKNSDGAELEVTYEGNKVIYISIDVPEEKEKKETSEKKSSNVSADFKETMDDYEDYIDDYVDFMNSYDESDMSMLSEYTEMLSKYEEVMSELDEIDEDELSDADYAYYVKVMGRIDEKLLEIEY